MIDYGSGALKVSVVGIEKNQAMLDKLRKLNLTKWFAGDAVNIVRKRLGEIIDKGVDRDFWSPLHPFTKENKSGRKVMVESGKLYKSITSLTKDSIFSVDSRGLELGSKLPYAAIQNFGGKIRVTSKMRSFLHWKGLHLKADTKNITIPKREYLFVSKPMETTLYNSLYGFIQRIIDEWKK